VLLGTLVPELRSQPNVGLLLLAVVLVNAVRHGLIPAMATALLAFLAYNFFFTEPLFSLDVSHWHDVLALAVFLGVAATTGLLAGRVRDQMAAARVRMAALQTLYDFARRLGLATTSEALLHAVVLQAHRLTGRPALILLPEGGALKIAYAWPPEDRIGDIDRGAAEWAVSHAEIAGTHTNTLPAAAWHFRPMRKAGGAVGTLGILGAPGPLEPDMERTIDAVLDQAAVAVDRLAFARQATEAETLAESGRFRSALLSSISHDLRTPLTSILGSVSALRRDPDRFDAAARDELLATIEEEAERLDRFVANLLDITRLESGAVAPKRDWVAIEEVIDAAARRVSSRLAGRRLDRLVPAGLPMLRGDFVLLETVLVNLLDNALKHAPGATRIAIEARAAGDAMLVSVTDDGAGVAAADLPHLFDKFFRIRRADRTSAGTGLGLSICKGFVEAMGGGIAAESPLADGRGARFTLRLPLAKQPANLGPREVTA
jgi:two-component system, OmpR family, sensor histidine kinase KdpD